MIRNLTGNVVNKGLALSAAFLGMLIFGICMISLGSVMPFIGEELQMDQVDKGSLAAILPVGILIGSLVFGPVVDRYSYRILLFVSALTAATGILVIGFSLELIGLQLAFFLIGLGGGSLNGATSALVSDLSTEGSSRKGANLSLLGVFFGIGALGIPAIMGLMPDSVSYRNVLYWIGSGIILAAIFFLFIRYPSAKQSRFQGLATWRVLLKKRLLVVIALVLFIQSGMESLINNWSTTYFIARSGLETQAALFSLTLFVLVFTLTRIMLKFLLPRISQVFIMAGALILTLIGGIIFHFSTGIAGAYLAVLFLGIGLASGFPVLLGIVGDAYSEWSGTAFSIVFTIAIIGNSLINYLVGWVTKASGLSALPLVLISCIAAFGILLVPVLKNIKSTHQ